MKKTNKPNPLKVFNDNKAMAYKKAGGEMAKYKVALKKAQDGIEMENDMMINKPGYGAKKTVNPTEIQAVPVRSNPVPAPEWKSAKPILSVPVRSNPLQGPGGFGSARSAAIQGNAARQAADIMSTVKKRGGSVKRKK